jgi:LmbE family N-acetylglucosaminyl deacetylase
MENAGPEFERKDQVGIHMMNVKIQKGSGGAVRVLCVGAHSDDIEIGCGGTILRLQAEHPKWEFTWVVFGADGRRGREAEKSAEKFLKHAGRKNVEILKFRDGFFPYEGARIKEYFERMKERVSPDLIFTHYRHDLHQDHRLISELTWNTYRDHMILEYEIIKYDGDLGTPNCYVPLDPGICKRKINYIRTCFPTQRSKVWFSDDAFYSILRLRGIESNAPGGYAEGFYGRKIVF